MSNDFYSPSGTPATRSSGTSSPIRAEFAAIEDGFDKLPDLTGNASKLVTVNAGATALDVSAVTATAAGAMNVPGILSVATNIRVFPSVQISGAGTITTSIPYGTGQTQGGGLLIVRGSSSGNQPFSAIYAVSTSINGTLDSVSAQLLGRTGAPTPNLTIGGTGGYVTVAVDATLAGVTSAFGIGF